MRLWELDDEARETWVQTNNVDVFATNAALVSTVTPGEGGNPAAPAGGATWTKIIKHAPTSGSGGRVIHRCQILPCQEMHVEVWTYIGAFDAWAAGKTNIKLFSMCILLANGNPGSGTQAFDLYLRGDALGTTGTFRAYVSDAGPNSTNVDVPVLTHTNNTPAWYKHVIKWKAASAVNTADGLFTWTIYAADGTTQLGTVTNAAIKTGPEPMRLVYIDTMSALDAPPAIYYGDIVVYDDVDGDTGPGILCPMLHSPTVSTVRLRLICDRVVDALVTCAEATVTPITLADDDDGRIHEFELSGLLTDTEYTWSATLDDGTTQTNITTINGETLTFKTPASSSGRVATVHISDSHRLCPWFVATRKTASTDATQRGVTPVVLCGGDILTNLNYTVTYDRAAARLLQANTLNILRQFGGTRISLWLDGNHEYSDMNAAVKAYVLALAPHRDETRPRHRVYNLGPVDIFALDMVSATPGAAASAAGVAAIDEWLTPALAASSAHHKVVWMHGFGLDVPTATGSSNEVTQVAMLATVGEVNPTASLHAALKARADLGERIYCLHGHCHGGSWWVKDNVTYIGSPAYMTISPKLTDYGNFTLPAGESDSILSSFNGYGSEEGSQGWVASLWTPGWSRHRIFDSKATDAVYAMRKVFEQWRMVR